MKKKIIAACAIMYMASACQPKPETQASKASLLNGTWKLISGTLVEKNDTTVTDYTQNKAFIKVLNNTHFAFMGHDLNKGKDSLAYYSSGGGTYTLKDSIYTEHLEYCSDRAWEGNSFTFTIKMVNDTLVQQGLEKVAETGVDRVNTEKYVRIKE